MTNLTLEQITQLTEVVQQAGQRMKGRFVRFTQLTEREDIVKRVYNNDEASLQIIKSGFERIYPGPRWIEDELEEGEMPAGEWWVVDPMEGAINHVHGMTDWCVTATLVCDNVPIFTTVYLPLTNETYLATRGGGAFLDGGRLSVSAKTDLAASMVGSGQASPFDSSDARRKLGQSATLLLQQALTVRMSVPATWQLIQVAAGRMDAFWQFSQVRSGLMSGALLVQEAGGKITDRQGKPWVPGSADFVAAAPGIHTPMLHLLSSVS